MSLLMSGKSFLVVGAGGLLGSKIVITLLNHNAKVIAADVDLKAMESRLSDLGVYAEDSKLELISIDISNESSVKDFFCSVNVIDGAVNATYPRNQLYGAHFFDVTLDSFNANLAMNLGGAFIFMQQCAMYFMKHNTPFSLVNISSIYGTVVPDFSIYESTSMTMPVEYAAIKSALLHLSKYAASYVGHSDFRINSVSPGGIWDRQAESFLNAYKEKTHGAGMLAAEDMVGAIVFLLSPQSRYVVGQNIIVDDGFTL